MQGNWLHFYDSL